MKSKMQEKTLNMLLSGKHPKSKKFAGHHVLVINNKVFPFKDGDEGVREIENLREKYGQSPIITFVPRQDITYVLFSCQK